ncbi:MAG: GNAT family N-acetyltransferase [Candidatus Micrarchaeota archaeon]|nr:GNAT family N-acetyltransferase [Candidatus Micrarchaeota archaeon]MDE1859647.1 GNAT family N-acetyltransferase [Candidatus Micrarchaeota archaeon]
MALVIRKGVEKDFPAVFKQIQELAEHEKMPGAVKISAEQLKKDRGLFGLFVAEENGGIVGYALYFFSYSTWVGKNLYMEDLYVKPEYRRRKVGSMLLSKVFGVAKKNGCKRVRWQVLDWNADAIKFYKKHGARISGQWLNCDFDEKGINEFLAKNA